MTVHGSHLLGMPCRFHKTRPSQCGPKGLYEEDHVKSFYGHCHKRWGITLAIRMILINHA